MREMRFFQFKRWLLLFFFGLAVFCTQAQSPFVLTEPNEIYRLDVIVEVFIDSANTLTIKDVSATDFKKFTHRGNLVFGYLKPNLWLRVKLKTTLPTTNWYLEIPAPFLEYVDFYQQLDSGAWKASKA